MTLYFLQKVPNHTTCSTDCTPECSDFLASPPGGARGIPDVILPVFGRRGNPVLHPVTRQDCGPLLIWAGGRDRRSTIAARHCPGGRREVENPPGAGVSGHLLE